jgi:hypothetical protein
MCVLSLGQEPRVLTPPSAPRLHAHNQDAGRFGFWGGSAPGREDKEEPAAKGEMSLEQVRQK